MSARLGPRVALVICGVVVAVDQATKALADSLVAAGDRVHVLPVLAFERTHNTGIAFGLAGDGSPVLIAVAVSAVVLLLGFIAHQVRSPAIWLAAGLLVGGAVGNLADRVRQGSVTDFIHLPAWPTFNLADLAITAGVAVLLVAYLRGDAPSRDREREGEGEGTSA